MIIMSNEGIAFRDAISGNPITDDQFNKYAKLFEAVERKTIDTDQAMDILQGNAEFPNTRIDPDITQRQAIPNRTPIASVLQEGTATSHFESILLSMNIMFDKVGGCCVLSSLSKVQALAATTDDINCDIQKYDHHNLAYLIEGIAGMAEAYNDYKSSTTSDKNVFEIVRNR